MARGRPRRPPADGLDPRRVNRRPSDADLQPPQVRLVRPLGRLRRSPLRRVPRRQARARDVRPRPRPRPALDRDVPRLPGRPAQAGHPDASGGRRLRPRRLRPLRRDGRLHPRGAPPTIGLGAPGLAAFRPGNIRSRPAKALESIRMADIATIAVVMPQMGDSVSEGTILEWHKAAGDRVTADETIVEISTDKVDAEVPATATGTIVAIHGAEGDTIGVGELLAEIAADTGG